MGAFGEKLRKQREQRGIALDAISNTTKISTRMLRALEDEHFDQLPGGVFNKGFVRAYARQVGLDEEEAITDYLAALRESQIQQQSILPDFRAPAGKSSGADVRDPRKRDLPPRDLPPRDLGSPDLRTPDLAGNDGGDLSPALPAHALTTDHPKKTEDRRHREDDPSPVPESTTDATAHPPASRFSNRYPAGDPSPPAGDASARIPWGMLAAALLLITLLLAFLNLRHNRGATAASNPANPSNQSPVQTPAPPPTRTSGATPSLIAGNSSPAGTLSVGTKPAGTLALTLPGAPSSSKTTAPSAASTTATATATAKPPVASKTPAPKPPPTFTLLIRAEKTTWVSIVADGKPVAEETLIAPAHTSVRATHEVYVRAGNAAGVSFLLNGKEFPAQGSEGEVKTYIFDATGVRVEPQPQTPATNR